MRGVYSIPVTPFEENGALDRDSLRRCVEFCIEAGAHGIVMPVNASEYWTLSDAERDEVVSIGVKAVAGAVPVVAGVTGNSAMHAVERAIAAQDAGADSVIAMPPVRSSGAAAMEDHFGAISGAVSVPIWIQNNKPPAGPSVPTDLIVRMLKDMPYVDYLKEESLLPGHVITAVLEKAGASCRGIMGGMGGRFLPDEYRRGACGTMPAGHITDAHVKLWDALEAGGRDADGRQVVTEEARDIWRQMLPALNFEFMFSVTAYKMAFWKRGIISTPATRSPAGVSFDKVDAAELDAILDGLKPLLSWSK
ncbi:MAG: dihydrodipicolinate synthase family protein [Dehalococcoidia bacterium]